MYSKLKVSIGFIVAIFMVVSIKSYYFNHEFFVPSEEGFYKDALMSCFVFMVWGIFGILGLYRKGNK